mgnify:CR=1 FL=1
MSKRPTQTTPKGLEIPVPTLKQFERDLEKATNPVKASTPRRRAVKK